MAEAEKEMICDFAETYHIYDYQELPLQYAAALVWGLRENSRVGLKLSGQKRSVDTLLLAAITDKLSLLVWFQTKDGQKNQNRPKSYVDELLGTEEKQSNEKPRAFSTKEELDAALAEFERKG